MKGTEARRGGREKGREGRMMVKLIIKYSHNRSECNSTVTNEKRARG
jgi:hypothetical protein